MMSAFEQAKRSVIATRLIMEDKRKQLRAMNADLDRKVEAKEISVEEWAEKTTDNEDKIGYYEALHLLIKAEKQFLQEARDRLEPKMPEGIRKKVAPVWDCKFSSIREEVVETMLRWFPDEEEAKPNVR